VDATEEREPVDGNVPPASHNLWIQGIFDPLTTDTGKTRFVIGSSASAWPGLLSWWRSSRGSDAVKCPDTRIGRGTIELTARFEVIVRRDR
jgi:hypothetical protein